MLRYSFYNFITPLLLFLICFGITSGFFTESVIWGMLASVVFGIITAIFFVCQNTFIRIYRR